MNYIVIDELAGIAGIAKQPGFGTPRSKPRRPFSPTPPSSTR